MEKLRGKDRARFIALGAVIVVLTAVAGFFPFVFLVPLLVAATFRNFKLTMFASLVFGLISILYSFMGGSVVALAFIANPLIPTVPRLMVGLGAHFSFELAYKTLKKRYVACLIAAAVGSLANSVLVVTALVLFTPSVAYEGVSILAYVPVMAFSGAIELAVNIAVVPPIGLALFKAKLTNDFSLSKPQDPSEVDPNTEEKRNLEEKSKAEDKTKVEVNPNTGDKTKVDKT